MKTLSATQARANMTRWLDEALAGRSVGITHKGRIVKLQPVPVTEDWAAAEYGLGGGELDGAAKALMQAGEDILASGQAIEWKQFKRSRRS
jgi:antitoxin (DNA-binding transcriptional repressor) of toxin-antitoxin stability system